MASNNPDLDNNVPDSAGAALIIIDMINDLEFPGGDALLGPALNAARQTAALKQRAREVGVPVVYANDNFGRWRSNFQEAVQRCLATDVRGRPLVELLRPTPEDYFILKPKHSAFYATPLELLLQHLACKRLILCGISGHMCVQFTACDAYMRDYDVHVPEDCTASEDSAANRRSLAYMREALKADITQSGQLDLRALAQHCRGQ